MAIVLWVWVTGELAGWLATGTWPPVALSQIPGVLVNVPGHLGHLPSAWPPRARVLLPGELPLVVVAAAVVAGSGLAVVGLAVAGRAARHRVTAGGRMAADRRWAGVLGRPGWRRPPPLGATGRGARWATTGDLRPLRLVGSGGRRQGRVGLSGPSGPKGPPGAAGRVILGRCGRSLVATESQHSVLVVGPTQSGKSSALAIPAILEWDGPVVATSVKDDLVAATLDWRRRRGRCWVFDPTTPSTPDRTTPSAFDRTATSRFEPTTGLPLDTPVRPPPADRPPPAERAERASWSPLPEAATWSGAQRMAGWLVDATPARSGMTDGGFWFAAAAKLLAPLLLAASRGGAAMADVVAWNTTAAFDEPLALLRAMGEQGATGALAAAARRDPRLQSSIATTLETVLAPFDDPTVADATAACDIDPPTLLRGAHTLYLCGPSHEQARVQGLFAALVSSVIAAAVDAVHVLGRPLDPPLLVVLDEAANIAPVRDLDVLASTAAGLGIQLVTVCQDLGQLVWRYGADRSRTIANNHRAKVVLSGVSDLVTLDLVSGLAGETAVTEETVTRDLRDGRRTRSAGIAFRRLAPTDELRRIGPGQAVLVYGHLPAARLRLRPWYEDAFLRQRVTPHGGASDP